MPVQDELGDRLLTTVESFKEAQSTPSQTDVLLGRIALPPLVQGERSPGIMSINYSTSDDPQKGRAHSAEIRILKTSGEKIRYSHIPGAALWFKQIINSSAPNTVGETHLDKMYVLSDLESHMPLSAEVFQTLQDRAFEDSDITKVLAAYLGKNARERLLVDHYRTSDPKVDEIPYATKEARTNNHTSNTNLYFSDRNIELKVARKNREIKHILSVTALNPVSQISEISKTYRLTADRHAVNEHGREWLLLQKVRAQSILASSDAISEELLAANNRDDDEHVAKAIDTFNEGLNRLSEKFGTAATKKIA
jgi:hypothetical protein